MQVSAWPWCRIASTATASAPPHLAAPIGSCATCHVPLAQAVRLTTTRRWPNSRLRNRTRPGFASKGHGRLAQVKGAPVAASCATCHARDFCLECHVNAPEVAGHPGAGPGSPLPGYKAELKAPPDHADPAFLRRHGSGRAQVAANCAICHTQESCLACHTGTPASAQAMPVAGPGRGRGADIHRERPASHGLDFSELHAGPARRVPRAAAAATCVRSVSLPPTQRRRSDAGIPPGRISHPPSRGSIQPGELVRRLPQTRASSAPIAT